MCSGAAPLPMGQADARYCASAEKASVGGARPKRQMQSVRGWRKSYSIRLLGWRDSLNSQIWIVGLPEASVPLTAEAATLLSGVHEPTLPNGPSSSFSVQPATTLSLPLPIERTTTSVASSPEPRR